MVLLAFFFVETYYKLSIKDAFYTIIPVLLYAVVYIYQVVLIGEEAGGWRDIYYLTVYIPFILSFLGMILVSILIALTLRFLYNKINEIRKRKFISELWDDEVSPVEVKIEFYGLGRYFGKNDYKTHTTLPLDIISIVSEKYHIKMEELIAAFSKGVLDS